MHSGSGALTVAVYTRRHRVTAWAVPWWAAVFVLPFWLMAMVLWVGFAILWIALVASWRFAVWACASLRFPQGVDTVGEEHSG
jgi:hypothetical protein